MEVEQSGQSVQHGYYKHVRKIVQEYPVSIYISRVLSDISHGFTKSGWENHNN